MCLLHAFTSETERNIALQIGLHVFCVRHTVMQICYGRPPEYSMKVFSYTISPTKLQICFGTVLMIFLAAMISHYNKSRALSQLNVKVFLN